MLLKTFHHWRQGIRLYIGLAIGLMTLLTWWWASVSYSGSTLFATRLEEVYAWLSLGLITVAVAIGPAYSLRPRLPGRRIMADARRLLGVGGGWFACLHVAIVYAALFETVNPFDVPKIYQQAFVLGIIALVILLAMVFTSFDGAFRGLGIWWFRLHRLVYAALLLSLFHAFMIGAHASQWPVLIILSAAALVLLGMHSYLAFVRARRPTTWQVLAISAAAVLLIAVFNYGYGQQLGSNALTDRYPNESQR